VNQTWGNFYSRDKLNPSFACRAGDPRLPSCTGDYWRPATVLADAVTLLSDGYRFGFRNEGDFDLRNNAGADAVLRRRQRGFFNNNFVTNGLSSGVFADDGNLVGGGIPGASSTALTDANYVRPATVLPTAGGPLPSSYFNNFVTPVQRRGPFPEYLMEVCTKVPVSECGDADWFVNPLATTPQTASAAAAAPPPNYTTPDYTTPAASALSPFQAGSTVDPPIAALQRFPRRVAFNRDTTNNRLLPNPLTTPPQPFGITGGNTIAAASNPPVVTPNRNSLWFATGASPTVTYDGSTIPYQVNTANIIADTRDGSNTRLPTLVSTVALGQTTAEPTPPYDAATVYNGTQPLLLPVLQLQNVSTATSGDRTGTLSALQTGWIPQARETTFNLIIGANDTPSRILNGGTSDFNGGLQNLPRFLESWGQNGAITSNIRGSFIQLSRSAFSTAPYQPIPTQGLATVFDQLNPPQPPLTPAIPTTYNIATGAGRIPYFSPPTRNWGYDVGLLSQPPDLFTQKLTTAPSRNEPAEFFREVARNDKWLKTLICGVKEDGTLATAFSGTAFTGNEACDKFPYQ